jgi:hypothetical protein
MTRIPIMINSCRSQAPIMRRGKSTIIKQTRDGPSALIIICSGDLQDRDITISNTSSHVSASFILVVLPKPLFEIKEENMCMNTTEYLFMQAGANTGSYNSLCVS